jgi:hypothetical protein
MPAFNIKQRIVLELERGHKARAYDTGHIIVKENLMRGFWVSVFVTVIAVAIFVVPAGSRPMLQSSFENIKVMKDMSDTEIRQEMMNWTEALGTNCNYCHEAGDFPSDMNPKKDIARKMFTMVKTINKDFLAGKAKCVLCHRGAAVPDPNL